MVQNIGVGGGCHWCTEAVFQSLRGVTNVEQGFMASHSPYDNYSEAVKIHFDPAIISVSDLVRVHLVTHASERQHSMRSKYRSAIYHFSKSQAELVDDILQEVRADGAAIITLNLPFYAFKLSEEKFQNYYAKDATRPFCQTYIEPKLAKMKKHYLSLLKE